MPTPLRLPLLLLLMLLAAAGGASAQFDKAWLVQVLGRFEVNPNKRFEDLKLYKSVLRKFPGGGDVHHIVPVNMLMKCVVLISKLGTDDLDPVVTAINKFVDALPEIPDKKVRVRGTVKAAPEGEYVYPWEALMEAMQWNPGNTVTGPKVKDREFDPGSGYERDIVDMLKAGNETEAARGRLLDAYWALVGHCNSVKTVAGPTSSDASSSSSSSSSSGTSNPEARKAVLAFFDMNVKLVSTGGVTEIPKLPYPDNMVGWTCSTKVPGKLAACIYSSSDCINPLARSGAGAGGAGGAGAGGGGSVGAGGAGSAGAGGASGAGAGGAGGAGAGGAASSAAGSSADGSSSSSGSGEGADADEEYVDFYDTCMFLEGLESAGEGAGGGASSAAGPSGSAEGYSGDGGSAASSATGAGGSGGGGD